MVHYDPLDKFYKSVTGAVKEGEAVTFRVKGEFASCNFLYRLDGENSDRVCAMRKKGDFFETEISFSRGLYWYVFSVGDGAYLGINANYVGGITDYPQGFQLTVYSSEFSTPEWIRGGIIYQIFPDRFCRGETDKKIENDKVLRNDFDGTPCFKPNIEGKVLNNDFFGGDFKGIESKLDYVKSLGVTAIYLNPIFKANSNHRYDTGDYMSFDPLLGTDKDFLSLINAAKSKGIRIILDGVFNHTGDDSLYFNKYGNYDSVGAYQSKQSKYYSWYKFIDYPHEYESWWGISILPALDKTNSDYVNFITGENGVIEKYMKMGVSGWRLDVVDELPGSFVKKIRSAVKKADKNAFIIGEVWEDATNKISYGARREYFIGEELDSVMNYPLKDAIIDYVLNGCAEKLSYVVKEQTDHYPSFALNSLMNILATHDTFRLLSAVGGVDVHGMNKEEMSSVKIPQEELSAAKNRLKAAVLLQYTLPGVPSIYYGDEIGMQGYTDPLNRGYFKWNKIDSEIYDFYVKLGKIREQFDAFTDGETEIVAEKNGVFSFIRRGEKSEFFIAVNFNTCSEKINFKGELTDLLSGNSYKNGATIKSKGMVVLAAIDG